MEVRVWSICVREGYISVSREDLLLGDECSHPNTVYMFHGCLSISLAESNKEKKTYKYVGISVNQHTVQLWQKCVSTLFSQPLSSAPSFKHRSPVKMYQIAQTRNVMTPHRSYAGLRFVRMGFACPHSASDLLMMFAFVSRLKRWRLDYELTRYRPSFKVRELDERVDPETLESRRLYQNESWTYWSIYHNNELDVKLPGHI